MSDIERSHRNIEPEDFGTDQTKPRRLETVQTKAKKVPDMKKKFLDTAFGRTVAGKNKTGRTIYSIIDVLPVPNIHEVVKAVIKDEQIRYETLSTWDLLKETYSRMDWLRTIAGVIAALILVKGSEWVGIDIDNLLEIIEKILSI